nr:hypothetical protein [Tellurirhabdus rosea]
MNNERIIGVVGALLAGWLAVAAAFPADRPAGTPGRAMVGDTVKRDPETGLVADSRLALVKAHCTACHSSKLILQNRFTRDGWKEKIRWMQRTQNLWDLGESEPTVLDYLVQHYGPEKKAFDGRRKPVQNVQWYKLQ